MSQHIVIAGSGFAGVWSALSAARAVALAGRSDTIRISVISPSPQLVIRPRLYEASTEGMNPDVSALLAAVGVQHLPGRIEAIAPAGHAVEWVDAAGTRSRLAYDRLVMAVGSQLHRPAIPGLADHGFDVDQLDSAQHLERHLAGLAARPDSPARNTVVVAGGGFTGIETAAEMPARLREILGADVPVRVVLVESAPEIGPDLGPGPRPVILEALAELGVDIVTGVSVSAVDGDGVTLADGTRIPAQTVVWTAGVRAHALTNQIAAERDRFGRLITDRYLRVSAVPDVYVTGDMACVATDDAGHVAAMSCQHALSLGRVSGHNAAAELVGLALHPYSQPKYVTCLDLGPWGAVYTEGWDRQVHLSGADAKALKREINTRWIYPPAADRESVFAIANPDYVIVP